HGDDSIVVQYEMHGVEDLGLLKMDFLGLSNLTIIEQALEVIKKIHGIEIDIDQLPLDNEKAFKLFQDGRTTGVFQFESSGMKRYLKQLRPTNLDDIIAMVALYRPGPMEYIPDYINGKHGRRKPKYLHPKLKPILEKTYGVAVYQEQLLQIARDLAGFSYGEADILRKAVGKKIAELLKEQEVKMLNGMVANGIDGKVAQKIWDFILPFASYGFNRSHAACYAVIGYQTAYLKANYPAEFMAALLTSDQGNSERIAIEIDECRQMGIEVMPPDVNESFSAFSVVAESLNTATPRVRFGLMAVKGLGERIVRELIRERKERGPYRNVEDLLTRVKDKDLNKRSLEAMIKSGCLDSLGERNQLLGNLDQILLYIHETHGANAQQDSLFGVLTMSQTAELKLQPSPPLDKRQKLAWEKQYLGLYVSEHPMGEYAESLRDFVIPCSRLRQCAPGSEVRIAGIVSSVKKILTKKGDAMLFVKIEDHSGDVETLVFPKVLEQYAHVWQQDAVIICSGKLSDKDDEPKVLCDRAVTLTPENVGHVRDLFTATRQQMNAEPTKNLVIKMPQPLEYELSKIIQSTLHQFPGNDSLELVVESAQGSERLKTTYRIAANANLESSLKQLLGEACIVG
ncbi:MAG: DNA polymerase III subunit alpha, partial [Candidatus Buchananbacteria bacterium]|nr:DNA polymerase III subunit alpha [Candidatus Buchananbacteria bacterium]